MYALETGRAGRDGLPAYACCFPLAVPVLNLRVASAVIYVKRNVHGEL